jgi:hypothetical protein
MRVLMAGLFALSLGGLALAFDDKKPEGDKPESRADRLKAIQAEQAKPAAEYRKVIADADKTAQEKTAAQREYTKALTAMRPKLAEKAMALALEDPKDDVALDALMLASTTTADAKVRDKARGLILEHHLANPKIGPMLPILSRQGRGYDTALLRTVVEKNPAKPVQAQAAFLMAQAVKMEAEGSKTKDADIAGKMKEAEKAFEKVIADYADQNAVVTQAKRAVEEIQKSPVGKETPEIEAEDIDGVKFKLSDYRGKVVLLDFWGHW